VIMRTRSVLPGTPADALNALRSPCCAFVWRCVSISLSDFSVRHRVLYKAFSVART
jgi:hypothetical protein